MNIVVIERRTPTGELISELWDGPCNPYLVPLDAAIMRALRVLRTMLEREPPVEALSYQLVIRITDTREDQR